MNYKCGRDLTDHPGLTIRCALPYDHKGRHKSAAERERAGSTGKPLVRIDMDDADRVVQNLMAEHEAVTANVVQTVMCGVPCIAVLMDEGEPSEQAFLLDEDGDDVPVMGGAQLAGCSVGDVVRWTLNAVRDLDGDDG